MPPKRRNPALSREEKASITKAARDLANDVNAELEEIKKARPPRISQEERERRNAQKRRLRVAKRRGTHEIKYCAGINLKGKPCQLPTLLKDTWDGDEEITGLYCLHHEPNIDNDSRESFRLFGTSKRKVYRRVTPGEIAHQLIQRSPQYFLEPYLKALGLRLTEDGELEKVNMGLKLHGFSRGGQVVRSPYPDYVGQVNVAEKMLDRIYGKARQSVDMASNMTTVAVSITMDAERVMKVADVLRTVGAFQTNGNGNGHVIDAVAHEVPIDEDLK